METRTGGEPPFNCKLFGSVSFMDVLPINKEAHLKKNAHGINLKSREKLNNKSNNNHFPFVPDMYNDT